MPLAVDRRTAPPDAAATTRVDLHLHSRASTDTGSWFLTRALMPESFVDPADAYATCKRRGMDLVTLTDHNTISGALEIAHHPDVLVGVEITTWFPEDRVPLHVLAWGIDEPLWADLDRARESLYDALAVLRARDVPHCLAHPLHRVGDDLTVDHLEKCLLLFPMWEGRNGARPALGNEVGVRIARSASPDLLRRLAEKHGIEPCGDGPPALTGGSDDHSVLEAACAWTQTPYAATPSDLLDHLRAGRTTPGGADGTASALAHSVGTLLLKRYAEAGAAGIPRQLRGPFADLIHHPLAEAPASAGTGGESPFAEDLMRRARGDRRIRREFRRTGRAQDSPERSRERLRLVTGWIHGEALSAALDPSGFTLGSLGRRLDALMAAGAVAAPYCLAARWMRDEREHAVAFERDFFGAPGVSLQDVPVKAAVFTDTFDQLNGAAGTMRRLAAWSASRADVPVTVITGGDPRRSEPGVRRMTPAVSLPVPAYADPGWRLSVPSMLDVLDAVDGIGARVVHAATPGPMGLAALLVARTLGLPFVASYHTELGEYAMHLTGDRLAAGVTRRAVRWFYSQAQRVYVPTRATGQGLLEEGIDPSRVYLFGRGADLEAFSPAHRSWTARQRMGGRGATVVLYVGRISREKGLLALARAFRRAAATRPHLQLVLVGDGPYREELARELAGTRHRFLGPLTGGSLASAYASADMFCLPSATETFGQVVLEAAASALPAIVTDRGGAQESVEHGVTGLVVPADDPAALAAAIGRLADDPTGCGLMGARAREAAGRRHGWNEVLSGLVDGYAELLGAPTAGPPSRPATVAERA